MCNLQKNHKERLFFEPDSFDLAKSVKILKFNMLHFQNEKRHWLPIIINLSVILGSQCSPILFYIYLMYFNKQSERNKFVVVKFIVATGPKTGKTIYSLVIFYLVLIKILTALILEFHDVKWWALKCYFRAYSTCTRPSRKTHA